MPEPLEQRVDALEETVDSVVNQLKLIDTRTQLSLLAPSLTRIVKEVIRDLPDDAEPLINVRVKRRHPVDKDIQEYDAVVEVGPYILVNETKSQLKPEDIPVFIDKLERFYEYWRDQPREGKILLGAMSSLHMDDSLVKALSKQGLVAIAIGDSISTVKSPEGFKWKAF